MKDVSMEQAREVHARLLVIDGHNDTPVERIHRGERPLDWWRRDPAYHTDVPRMREGGYHVGFMVVGNGPTADIRVTAECMLEEIDAHPDELALIRGAGDIQAARDSGRIGILMTIEGAGRWLEGKPEVLRLYHRLGIRCVGITHGEGGEDAASLQGSRSPFGPCTAADRETERKTAKGLTPFGIEILKASNEMGIVTDLSHINDRAFYEVLERSSRPVVMTHTAAFALCPHWRCLTDDQIRALAAAGGAMGIAFVPSFIHAQEATIDRLVEHILYVRDLVGIDHVAIGADFDGIGETVPIVPDVAQLPLLTRSMLAHGLSEAEIRKVWGENLLRIIEKAFGS